MPTTQTQPALLPVDDAYGIVHQKVYQPVFFEKLAHDYGIAPSNDDEAMEMLTMAAQLRQQYDADQEKRAASGNTPLSRVRQQLGAQFPETASPAPRIKEAAAQAAADPELAHAVLSLQAAAFNAQQ